MAVEQYIAYLFGQAFYQFIVRDRMPLRFCLIDGGQSRKDYLARLEHRSGREEILKALYQKKIYVNGDYIVDWDNLPWLKRYIRLLPELPWKVK